MIDSACPQTPSPPPPRSLYPAVALPSVWTHSHECTHSQQERGQDTNWLGTSLQHRTLAHSWYVQWSEDKIKADPFFRRSRVRLRVRTWVLNTSARDHLA